MVADHSLNSFSNRGDTELITGHDWTSWSQLFPWLLRGDPNGFSLQLPRVCPLCWLQSVSLSPCDDESSEDFFPAWEHGQHGINVKTHFHLWTAERQHSSCRETHVMEACVCVSAACVIFHHMYTFSCAHAVISQLSWSPWQLCILQPFILLTLLVSTMLLLLWRTGNS